MNIYKNPQTEQIQEILKRPIKNQHDLSALVKEILDDIKTEGDKAILRYEQKFDHVDLSKLDATSPLMVSEAEFNHAEAEVSQELKNALTLAHNNITRFHKAQLHATQKVETIEGVTCWQKAVPIQRVGLYVPGGTAPLFSTVLMLATPARIAGCEQIILVTPPRQDGSIHPAILVAARISGVSHVYKAGGVQAIGAMAYGTESIPQVYKIFGPGNQYVQAAKQIVSLNEVAIDMPAGPSEVAIIADETAKAQYVAADLLSQAEHGIDSQTLLITTSPQLMEDVQEQLKVQLSQLPRCETASAALSHSRLVLVDDIKEAMKIVNLYAPEHLIIQTKDAITLAEQVINAGSVFIGHLTPESAGDYASGTNHTLPTNGWAKAYSGVNLDAFYRKITFQHITEQGLNNIGPAVEIMAEAENLLAHSRAMSFRRNIK